MSARAMHPRLAEIDAYLESSRTVLLAALEAIPEARRDERTSEGAWTAGQVLDHVALVETSVARLLERRAERGRAEGLGADGETSSILGCLDAYPVQDRSHRLEAPEMVRPREVVASDAGLAALSESRRVLRAAMVQVNGLDLRALRARHPLLGELDLYQWLVMVGKHDRRHAEQLDALRSSLAPH